VDSDSPDNLPHASTVTVMLAQGPDSFDSERQTQTLTIEATDSDWGGRPEERFYVIKTERWSVGSMEELKQHIETITAACEAVDRVMRQPKKRGKDDKRALR